MPQLKVHMPQLKILHAARPGTAKLKKKKKELVPDTHRKCRVFETGSWGWIQGEDATYSCSGTSGYCLRFLMIQTILQVRLLGFGDRL